ncbi:hypothetical protein [Tabrizicola sp.]|jgi:hypothetical protein|uniref:hypothetical protein n=1 Tax=Tabrizicola sp. TaxID=2005166 RepID=UPI001A5A40F0|nr:hypothetical protein [Tabrizicola sp.]
MIQIEDDAHHPTNRGRPRERCLNICETIGEYSTPDRAMTSRSALGWTQHSKGRKRKGELGPLAAMAQGRCIAAGADDARHRHPGQFAPAPRGPGERDERRR